eukprot:270-Ditylum_brightwellii.AAC.1
MERKIHRDLMIQTKTGPEFGTEEEDRLGPPSRVTVEDIKRDLEKKRCKLQGKPYRTYDSKYGPEIDVSPELDDYGVAKCCQGKATLRCVLRKHLHMATILHPSKVFVDPDGFKSAGGLDFHENVAEEIPS